MLVVLVMAMGVMGHFGFGGLSRISQSADGLQRAALETHLDGATRAGIVELQSALHLYIAADQQDLARAGRAEIEADIARLEVNLREMGRRYAGSPVDLADTQVQQRQLARVVAVWRSGGFDVARGAHGAAGRKAAMVRRVRVLLEPMIAAGDALAARDARMAVAAGRAARRSYGETRDFMAVVFAATMLIGIGMVLWLIRTVVPRMRRYSGFAARVSAGDLDGRLDPTGADELADLGRSLDEMVARHEQERAFQLTQSEFVDGMQVTESEDEAHELIVRHLQRSIDGSVVTVLNRNNSDDRLESRGAVAPDSPLAEGLDGATPRSCLAVRLGRRHESGGDRDPLLACEVCGGLPDLTTCNPLLVGGQVIGSVLINHPDELELRDDDRIRHSVAQAAPVLANLRNLAIAEMRAATDALTGLPNTRAVQDTLKRMVAHAARSGLPLATVLLDLDHFKQINDTYGHGRGDEVLAAVAEAMTGAVRAGDFVGRYGGEEFVVLYPDTDVAGALTAAETLRAAVAAVTLPAVDRAITASLGVAVMPEDGMDADTLVRNADRALYVAKSSGRNRVEIADPSPRAGALVPASPGHGQWPGDG